MVNQLIFPNVTRTLVQYLKSRVSPDVLVSSVIPKTRKDRMVIVINTGGAVSGSFWANASVNIMVWGKTWEESLDLSLEIDAHMRSLNQTMGNQISRCVTEVLPIPTGDGDSTETPVHSSSYGLTIISKNSEN